MIKSVDYAENEIKIDAGVMLHFHTDIYSLPEIIQIARTELSAQIQDIDKLRIAYVKAQGVDNGKAHNRSW